VAEIPTTPTPTTGGRTGAPGELLARTLEALRPLDADAVAAAHEHQDRLTKPKGSLGGLEDVSVQLAGLAAVDPPPLPEPAVVVVFAADHGVHAQGVSPWPQEVTAQMVANLAAGGAVVNALAAQTGAQVVVVDVGVATDVPSVDGVLVRKVRPGTADLSTGAAMSRDEAVRALEVGIDVAEQLVADGARCLLTGDMGIANTTASAALVAALLGFDAADVTGRGTGIDDATLAIKTDVVRRALALHEPDRSDPVGVLAAVGGLEHAALAGWSSAPRRCACRSCSTASSPGAAAPRRSALHPDAMVAALAGHRSAEPGHAHALRALGLRPLIELDLRLGEGSGAVLALPLVQSAARVLRDVATFDSAGVSDK
jgi:nicotinate-nucleotide--dimethylbenzimidazole phosphoribosyltransferase